MVRSSTAFLNFVRVQADSFASFLGWSRCSVPHHSRQGSLVHRPEFDLHRDASPRKSCYGLVLCKYMPFLLLHASTDFLPSFPRQLSVSDLSYQLSATPSLLRPKSLPNSLLPTRRALLFSLPSQNLPLPPHRIVWSPLPSPPLPTFHPTSTLFP